MYLGLVSAICDTMNFEEMIDFVFETGLECVEAACRPAGKAERRYAGVSHMDAEAVLADDAYAEHIIGYAAEKNEKISSLADYPNTMDADLPKRQAAVEHLKKLICASAKLGVNMVTTFIGRDQTKTVEENLKLVQEIWPPILSLAEEKGVKIAIENCPMLFGANQWPGGQNLMTPPSIWRKVFALLPSKNLGINYDPSHLVWQMIDYIKPVYEFQNKIFHVHYKDIKLYPDRLHKIGIMGYPLDFMSPKLPGLGDVDRGRSVSALTDIHYNGYTCIEVEDKAKETVIVMDNASFHRKEPLYSLAEKYGCFLIFLPPYSPELNPIEHFWSWLKHTLRKILPKLDSFDEALFAAFYFRRQLLAK